MSEGVELCVVLSLLFLFRKRLVCMLLMGFWKRSALEWRYVSISKGFIANEPVAPPRYGGEIRKNLVSSQSEFPRVNIRKSSLKVIGRSTRIFFRVSEFPRVSIRQSSLKVIGSSIRIFSELPRDINANVTSVKVFVRIHSIGWFRS